MKSKEPAAQNQKQLKRLEAISHSGFMLTHALDQMDDSALRKISLNELKQLPFNAYKAILYYAKRGIHMLEMTDNNFINNIDEKITQHFPKDKFTVEALLADGYTLKEMIHSSDWAIATSAISALSINEVDQINPEHIKGCLPGVRAAVAGKGCHTGALVFDADTKVRSNAVLSAIIDDNLKETGFLNASHEVLVERLDGLSPRVLRELLQYKEALYPIMDKRTCKTINRDPDPTMSVPYDNIIDAVLTHGGWNRVPFSVLAHAPQELKLEAVKAGCHLNEFIFSQYRSIALTAVNHPNFNPQDIGDAELALLGAAQENLSAEIKLLIEERDISLNCMNSVN